MTSGAATLSYGQLNRQLNQFGSLLRRLGVEPEQRVLLLMLDTLAFPACFLGAIKFGAVAVPVNTMLDTPDFAYFLKDSRARVLVVDEALWPKVASIVAELPHLRHVLVANGSVAGRMNLARELAAETEALAAELVSPDDQAFWLYTSGSTGTPKAAVHAHRNMVEVTESYASKVLGLTVEDVAFSAAKFFFAYGLGNSLYMPLASGGRSVLLPGRPTPQDCFAMLAQHRPTVFFGVPTLFNAMLNLYESWQAGQQNPPQPLPALDSLRFSVSAGESLPPDLLKRWLALFGTPILDGIGSTEMTHVFISNQPGQFKEGSTGRIVPGYEARLVDEAGQEVADGEIGALLIKGDSAAGFYWNKREKTRGTMLGEWLVTGDQFHRDAEEWYWYHGRNDDMMKVSGSWVSPTEVENALISHAAVFECAVVGQADGAGLTKTKAFVVLAEGHGPSEALTNTLQEFVKGQIAGFKSPTWIEYVGDLPKTATGKIKRFELRQS